MSRKMKGKEMDAFEAKFGYKPTPFPVAIDALAVYVNTFPKRVVGAIRKIFNIGGSWD
jgi:ABC-type phosphate transport system substrate-binding protein